MRRTLVAPVKEDAGFNFREITNAKQVDLVFHSAHFLMLKQGVVLI